MKRFFKWVGIVVAILVGLLLVLVNIAEHSRTPEQRAKIAADSAAQQAAREAQAKKEAADKRHYRATHAEIEAFIAAQDYVKPRLKSPASAKFASKAESTVVNHGEGKYLVRSYVDSQNAFGAMIRTEYFCDIITADGERFVVTRFTK